MTAIYIGAEVEFGGVTVTSGTRLTGRVVTPGDPIYDAARLEFNARYSRRPLVIVFAREIQDVVNAVRWAREHGVPLRARCGRHSYEALSVVDGGLIVDVSEMNQVQVDRRAGTCPTVGIAGLALGGGVGFLSREMGLTCDNLLAVEMVDAFGRVLRADECQNADLL